MGMAAALKKPPRIPVTYAQIFPSKNAIMESIGWRVEAFQDAEHEDFETAGKHTPMASRGLW